MALPRRAAWMLLAALLVGAAALAAADAAEQPGDTAGDTTGATAAAAAAAGDAAAPPKQRPPFMLLKQQDSWVIEGCFIALLLTFLVNLWFGRRANEQLALAWTSELVAPDGVLARNFALLGPGDTAAGEVLLKDSMFCYKFWASGRRFCQGLLLTFNLTRRQDLIARLWALLRSGGDWAEVEVRMQEGAMPPMVLAIAPPGTLNAMKLDCEDIKNFCRKVEVTRDRAAQWPDKLAVMAEHSSIFYDLLAPQLAELAFSKESFAPLRKYFRALHITSEAPEGHRQVIKLSFTLPPLGDTATLSRFLALACLLADLVGCYKLGPEQAKRAAEARSKREEERRRDGEDERAKRAEERRQAKLAEEQERLRKLPPDQRQKEIEKKQKLQQRRRMMRMAKSM